MPKPFERCSICNCELHRSAGTYAQPTIKGRSHATKHHFVAERLFGRSANRTGSRTDGVFSECPWGIQGKSDVFCYECHEELLHNPILLPNEIRGFAELSAGRGFSEIEKSEDRSPLAGRVKLFHEVIARGIEVSLRDEPDAFTPYKDF